MSALTRTSLSIMPFVFGILIAMGVLKLDAILFPVVKDFNVMTVRQEPHRVVFSGTMNKVRACEFLGVTASGGDHFALGVSFDDDISRHTSTRPTGRQEWGPWHIDIVPSDNVRVIELVAIHRCTFFGNTTTHLTTIKLG